MKFEVERGQAREKCTVEYSHHESKRPMALDVLLQAKAGAMPDLAFRYGCRNELCGVCTIEVNGEPRLACRTRVDEGDCLGALSTLPLLTDLVVQREPVNRQLLQIAAGSGAAGIRPPGEAPAAFNSLNRCIECYACLSGCPMHARNAGLAPDAQTGFRYGNPYTLLKLQRAMLAPGCSVATQEGLLRKAVELGLDSCLDCDGCKCQVGISLPGEVIEPLLHAASGVQPGF